MIGQSKISSAELQGLVDLVGEEREVEMIDQRGTENIDVAGQGRENVRDETGDRLACIIPVSSAVTCCDGLSTLTSL